MGITDGLVLDGAQPKALVGVVGRLLEPPVVEDEHLRLRIFEIDFTVVGAFQATSEMSARGLTVETGAVEKRDGG